MINNDDNPVQWALLVNELDEAREHLDSLTRTMVAKGTIDESDYAVQVGHIYAHLNRAWASRRRTTELPFDEWEEASQFPTDLSPVG